MLTFDGQRDFPVPPATLWAKLRDAAFLVACVPDGTVKGTPQRERAECTVRPGVSFIRGSLDVVLEILEAVEPTSVRLQLASKGIGTSSDVVVNLTIAPQGEGARIEYHAELTRLGGLLRALPSGLIRGAAQKIIEDVWANVARNV